MKIQLVTKPLSEIATDYIVLPIFEDEKPPYNGIISDFLAETPKFGKLYEFQLLYSKNKKLLLLGAGKKDKFDYAVLQNWVGSGVRVLWKKTKTMAVVIPANLKLSSEEIGQALTIGIELALHDPAQNYKSDFDKTLLTQVEVVVQRAEKGYQDGIKKGMVIAEGINLVRSLGDKPANEMTPTYFLNVAKKIAKEDKLKLTVITEKQAAKMKMGAFVGVAQGSVEPSYMLALEYKGDIKTKEKWGLVGKGITFDSGGISIKPSSNMAEMKYDMSGAAACLAAIMVIAKLGIKVNVVTVCAVTENLLGGRAQKPGDIVKTYSGKTAEVLNTDAEGRLVLVDALEFARKDFKATKLIDLATLTGACIVALGDFYSGAFTNDEKFVWEVVAAGKKVGEKIWQLPMDEDYNEMIKSEFADITNIGIGGSIPGAAGAITGAKFLETIVNSNGKQKTPWVHLDIAGTAWDMKPKPFRGVGATGVGVKTLVKLIEG